MLWERRGSGNVDVLEWGWGSHLGLKNDPISPWLTIRGMDSQAIRVTLRKLRHKVNDGATLSKMPVLPRYFGNAGWRLKMRSGVVLDWSQNGPGVAPEWSRDWTHLRFGS